MRFDVLTLFPELCAPMLQGSILGRASAAGHIDARAYDLRTHGLGRHRAVDDTPFGGGSGMVMRVDVVDAALQAVCGPESHVVLMDPAGTPFTQACARRLAQHPHLVLICGHYEGVDGRVRQHLVHEALSIGDYVLTGGELAALVVVDAVARMVPGVLGNPESLSVESFGAGAGGTPTLEAPCFTRPRQYRDWAVPDVLLSGHHARIEAWRAAEGERLTSEIRPDLRPIGEAALGGPPESERVDKQARDR